MSRRDVIPAGWLDAEALTDDADERPGLHLADARRRKQPLLEILAGLRVAPDAPGVAVVVTRQRRREILRAPRHVGREAVERRPFPERGLELGRIHRGDALGIERADALLQLVWAGE